MPRYEAEKLFSKRFWEIERSGALVTIVHGKVGKIGKREETKYASNEDAEGALESATRKMIGKGYRLIAPAAPVVPSQSATFAPANPELEAALLVDRDDETAWRVLGDWLEGEGDPRGKAISLSFANDPDAADEHIAAYAKSWLGELYPSYQRGLRSDRRSEAGTTVEWTHGVMHHVRIANSYDDMDCHDRLDALLALPSARFLHSLTLGILEEPDGTQYAHALEALRANPPPMLRHLFLGDFTADECEISWSSADGLDEFLAIFPQLHSLKVHAGLIGSGPIEHSALRSLIIESGGCGEEITKVVGSARLPKLEVLELWTGQQAYGGYGPLTDYAPLLAGKSCPNLKHLAFRNAEQADAFVGLLADSALLPQLRSIDFSLGMFGPHGARTLIANKQKFAHLEMIDVSETQLGQDVVADLTNHFGDAVQAGEQLGGVSYQDWDDASVGATTDEARLDALFELDCYTAVGE